MLGPFGLGLAVFTFVFLVGTLFRLLDLLLNSGVSMLTIGELIASLMPGILSITTPMALLVAILLGIGRLAADREILAIRMSGVNLFHICVPILALAALLAAAMMAANQKLVPYLNLKSADLATQIEFKVLSAIPPDRFYNMDSGDSELSTVFFYDHRDTQTAEMRGVTIRNRVASPPDEKLTAARNRVRSRIEELSKKKDDPKVRAEIKDLKASAEKAAEEKPPAEVLITARQGRITADLAERLIMITLTSGSLHFANTDRPSAYTTMWFDTLEKGIKPRFSKTQDGFYRKSPREMAMSELRGIMRSIKPGANTSAKTWRRQVLGSRVEFYQRFSIPLACIAFALIAIPLAIYVRPTGKAIAFAISFLLILVYYGLLTYGVSLGETGSRWAPFGIFSPNILLAAVGSFLLYRMVMK